MNWIGKRVLVTGAGGFIGSHLTERLVAEGATVRALVRYNSRNDRGLIATLPEPVQDAIELITGDVRDADTVHRAVEGMDLVMHLAALISIPYSYRNPAEFVQTNVVGTTNILDAARRANVQRVIHTSTSEVYGTARSTLIDEAHPLQPQSPYSASKIAADALVSSYGLAFGFPVSIVRPFNTFGPRQSLRAVIPTIITQALKGDRLKLGRLDTTRDFNFVGDTVEGFLRVAQSGQTLGRAINLGTGRDVAIGEVVRLVGRILGKTIDVEVEHTRMRPDASEVMRLCADASAARDLAGWTPQVDFETGLARTIDWVRAQRDVGSGSRYVV